MSWQDNIIKYYNDHSLWNERFVLSLSAFRRNED